MSQKSRATLIISGWYINIFECSFLEINYYTNYNLMPLIKKKKIKFLFNQFYILLLFETKKIYFLMRNKC
jgi:hypothetical protein